MKKRIYNKKVFRTNMLPLTKVQNKYSLWRLCVDNRKLNEKIIQDVYPIPRILDLLVDLILPMTEKSNVINLVCLQQLLYYESKTMDMYKIETLEHKASAYKVSSSITC